MSCHDNGTGEGRGLVRESAFRLGHPEVAFPGTEAGESWGLGVGTITVQCH